jgi:hypothetical protein
MLPERPRLSACLSHVLISGVSALRLAAAHWPYRHVRRVLWARSRSNRRDPRQKSRMAVASFKQARAPHNSVAAAVDVVSSATTRVVKGGSRVFEAYKAGANVLGKSDGEVRNRQGTNVFLQCFEKRLTNPSCYNEVTVGELADWRDNDDDTSRAYEERGAREGG